MILDFESKFPFSTRWSSLTSRLFSDARLVSINPALSHSQQEAMTFYMRSYLEFLERAGHHVLFDLPGEIQSLSSIF